MHTHLITRLLTCITLFAASLSTPLPAQNLTYEARYHLGLIKVKAGEALIGLDIQGDNIDATLNGRSISWHGRVYCISDTIRACVTVLPDGSISQNVFYVNGRYSKPKAKRLEAGDYDFSDPDNYRTIHGRGLLSASGDTMEAVTISADMLAMFKLFGIIDFETMQPGTHLYIPISLPNGDVQHVAVTYHGPDTYGGQQTYRVIFEYSYHGAMSNYPVTCHIVRDSRLPLIFSADLKIGHIELLLKDARQ